MIGENSDSGSITSYRKEKRLCM